MPAAPAPRVTACADEVLRRVGLLNNVYFQELRDGSMSRECFRRSQEQFFFAVRYFPRPMAALIARIGDPVLRLDILKNLVEEHGDFQEEEFHQNTFRAFLGAIGARDPQSQPVVMCPAAHAFNNTLMATCAADELEVGIGCLGIIEYAFASISAVIGRAVVDRGWVESGQLVHYGLHAELDVRHSQEFFAIVEPRWDDAGTRGNLQQGLELGAYAFDQLYRSLHVHGNAQTEGS